MYLGCVTDVLYSSLPALRSVLLPKQTPLLQFWTKYSSWEPQIRTRGASEKTFRKQNLRIDVRNVEAVLFYIERVQKELIHLDTECVLLVCAYLVLSKNFAISERLVYRPSAICPWSWSSRLRRLLVVFLKSSTRASNFFQFVNLQIYDSREAVINVHIRDELAPCVYCIVTGSPVIFSEFGSLGEEKSLYWYWVTKYWSVL